jgi:hypothetical protein
MGLSRKRTTPALIDASVCRAPIPMGVSIPTPRIDIGRSLITPPL